VPPTPEEVCTEITPPICTTDSVKTTTVYKDILPTEQDGDITKLRADWAVEFEVDRQVSSVDRRGFIVQHIKEIRQYTDASGNSVDTSSNPLEYWESWDVPAGQNIVGYYKQTSDETGLSFDFDDNWVIKTNYEANGFCKTTGIVKFCEYDGDTLPEFVLGAVAEARRLEATSKPPIWGWNDQGGTQREWEVEWDNFESWMQVSASSGSESFTMTYPR
jgi:hypothetical protein